MCIFTFSSAEACIARVDTPDPRKPEKYDSIFVAKVESFEVIPGLLSLLDITPSYKVTLSKPIETIFGKEQISDSIIINAGCGIPRPQKGKAGVFFSSFGKSIKVEPLIYDDPDAQSLRIVIREVDKAATALRESKTTKH